MTDLFNSMAHQLCNIKALDISQTNLDDHSVHAIVRCLTNNKTLQKMNISHTLISGCSKQIAAAIQKNKRLLKLEMEEDMLDIEAVKQIKLFLKRNRENKEILDLQDLEKEKELKQNLTNQKKDC